MHNSEICLSLRTLVLSGSTWVLQIKEAILTPKYAGGPGCMEAWIQSCLMVMMLLLDGLVSNTLSF